MRSTGPTTPFLLLGAAKCGTTSLYHYLGQHPDLVFSEPKEPVFFEAEFENGLEYYWSRYFRHWRGESAAGDARVYNLFLPYVPSRIHRALPEARLLAILRNPVDRAYSLWWHRVAIGRERRSFEDALEDNRRRIRSGQRFEGESGAAAWRRELCPRTGGTRVGTYLDGGYFAEQLERYRALFPAEQIRVVLLEDLEDRPLEVCSELWRFLGLAPLPELETTPRNLARSELQRPAARRLRRWAHALGLDPWVPTPVRRRLGRLLVTRRANRPPMRSATRQQLIAHYREPNRQLGRMLGRDLSHWDD